MSVAVEPEVVIESTPGRDEADRGRSVPALRSVAPLAAPDGYIDNETRALAAASGTWLEIRAFLQAKKQNDPGSPLIPHLEREKARTIRLVNKTFKAHALWPWLSQHPGLTGPYVARLVSSIKDPRRFPGQQCSVGHTFPPLYEVGEPCPFAGSVREGGTVRGNGHEPSGAVDRRAGIDELPGCPGTMLDPRPHTGVRSLWHYWGLHVVDGKLPRKQRGVQCDWLPWSRAFLIGDGGVAEQILRHQVSPYIDRYYKTKDRLTKERGAEVLDVTEVPGGPADSGGRVAPTREDELALGLPPWRIEKITRTIVAKAWAGDLLTTWKGLS